MANHLDPGLEIRIGTAALASAAPCRRAAHRRVAAFPRPTPQAQAQAQAQALWSAKRIPIPSVAGSSSEEQQLIAVPPGPSPCLPR